MIALVACGGAQPAPSPAPPPSPSPIGSPVPSPASRAAAKEASPAPSPEAALDPRDDDLVDVLPSEVGASRGHVATLPEIENKPDFAPYPKAILRRVIRRSFDALAACYRDHGALDHRVDVDFTIGGDGKVVSAMSKPSGNDALDSCLAGVFRTLVFPPPRGGGQIHVTYPVGFVFAEK